MRRVYAVVCGGQQNQEEGQCRWGIPEGGRSAGAPCPHTQDGILYDLNFHRRWTVRIYDLVTTKECHVLHLRSGEATDVSIYTKLNVDPCTEKFTPSMASVLLSVWQKQSFSVCFSKSCPAHQSWPGCCEAVCPFLLPDFQFFFFHSLPRTNLLPFPTPSHTHPDSAWPEAHAAHPQGWSCRLLWPCAYTESAHMWTVAVAGWIRLRSRGD